MSSMESEDADLSVTLIVPKRVAQAGDLILAVVTLCNHGPGAATSITARISVPRGLSVLDASEGEIDDGGAAATLRVSEMPCEGRRHWDVRVQVREGTADGDYPVVAEVECTSNDPEPDNDVDRKTVRVRGRTVRNP